MEEISRNWVWYIKRWLCFLINRDMLATFGAWIALEGPILAPEIRAAFEDEFREQARGIGQRILGEPAEEIRFIYKSPGDMVDPFDKSFTAGWKVEFRLYGWREFWFRWTNCFWPVY